LQIPRPVTTVLIRMLRVPVNRFGDAGMGFALILTKRSREPEINTPQTTQNDEIAISMMLRPPLARIAHTQGFANLKRSQHSAVVSCA
jgi:hypothetical protein